MLRSLMVPLDGSGFSEYCLPLAGGLARSAGASLHLAHVHTPYEPDDLLFTTPFQFEHVDMAEYDARHREKEDEYMTETAARISGDGLSVDAAMLDGTQVAEALIEYGKHVGTDLAIMTSHGRSGVRRAWLGSVTDELIRQTPFPTLIIHPAERRPGPSAMLTLRHILVPLDGSEFAAHVLGRTIELARATGARVTLTRVVPSTHSPGPAILELGPRHIDPQVEVAIGYLEDTAASLRREGVTVATHVMAAGAPAAALARLADRLDADLIAIATHGLGGLKRTVLGSVTDQLLRCTGRPILVIRPPSAAAA